MNHSTVHLQPVPTVLSAEAALARIAALEAEVARLSAACDRMELERDAARSEVDRLIAGLASLRREHGEYYRLHDDAWYSCPAGLRGAQPCLCGAAAYNARIDVLLTGEGS